MTRPDETGLSPQWQSPQTATTPMATAAGAPPISGAAPGAGLPRDAAAGLGAADGAGTAAALRQATHRHVVAAGRRVAQRVRANTSLPAAHAWARGRSWRLLPVGCVASPAIRRRCAGAVVRAARLAILGLVRCEVGLRGLTQGGEVAALYATRFACLEALSKRLGFWIFWD